MADTETDTADVVNRVRELIDRGLFPQGGEELPDGGEVLTLDDAVLRRNGDGRLLPIRVPLGTGHDIWIRPLTYGQSLECPEIVGAQVERWPPETKARLIAENLVEPDLFGHWKRDEWDESDPPDGCGLSRHPGFLEWLKDRLDWGAVNAMAWRIVTHSTLRNRPAPPEPEEGEKKGSAS